MSMPARKHTPGVGRPLIAGMALLSGWIAIRASMWEPPFPLPSADALFAQAKMADRGRMAVADAGKAALERVIARAFQPARAQVQMPGRQATEPDLDKWYESVVRLPATTDARAATYGQLSRSRMSAGHQSLFAAALSFLPSYQALVNRDASEGTVTVPGRAQRLLPDWQLAAATSGPVTAMGMQSGELARKPDRWSADAWLLVREGGSNPRLSSVNPASYGSNQAGAVVRYALAPDSALAPNAYARASKALVSGGETEGAAGVSISLSRSFPLRVHGEVRVTDRPGATEVRPAAFVVTGLPRQRVGPGLEADVYVQAGYVGGDFETGFVDGKATLEAPVIAADKGRIAVGGGVWGGAQRDASRLDVGPTASVVLSTGKATMRASLDYRIRVAGDASPGDGVAVTLAASF